MNNVFWMPNPNSGVQVILAGNQGWKETKVGCHAYSPNKKTHTQQT